MNTFLGIPAVEGIGQGIAFVIPDAPKRIIPHTSIQSSQIDSEWKKFQDAVQKVSEKLNAQLSSISKSEKLQHDILETQLLMLNDPIFFAELHEALVKNLFNIEYVLDEKIQSYVEKLRSSNNEYLAERAKDVSQVFGNVLDSLLGITQFSFSEIPNNAVVVAKSLSPSAAVSIAKKAVALVVADCGVSSHAAIIARNYGIPSVVAIQYSAMQISSGDFVIVDGNSAQVIVNPNESVKKNYEERISSINVRNEELALLRDKQASTKDGTSFELFANIGSVEEAEIAFAKGADGIGLFRTEFLFMQEGGAVHLFDEDMQFHAYRKVLEIMQGKPVTIRTLDLGGDKLINNSELTFAEEKNPLMGLRAVRLSLMHPKIIRTQLRALYRASVYGKLRIMIPLITSMDQIRQCKYLAREVKAELRSQRIPFDENVPLGIMIETAAAAISADCFAKECEFFSLGTNDLTQYTLAVDRENPSVSNLYNEFNLAVLRLISMTLDGAKNENIPVSVCGEMAGNKNSVLVLAGMGIRSLSMSPQSILEIKELLSNFTIDELCAISGEHLNIL
ncbi:MAG: phosphoenolpyruvate--protein phosphotransferase [Treponema sp.]|nr:phosphoenolpyruvate--protein phosphotransferase [Treponema sp.]